MNSSDHWSRDANGYQTNGAQYSTRQTQTVYDDGVQADAGSWYEGQYGTPPNQDANTHGSSSFQHNSKASTFVDDRKREEEYRRRLHDREGRRAHKNDMKDKIDEMLLPIKSSSHKEKSSRNNDESKKKKKR